ncbi:fructose-6-phosphate aldolase [Candidatus Bipolaricaulota bacterium]|nr:fructose-6-phosphate aldolase [Candidatus Bipolaricaulota bacterium]
MKLILISADPKEIREFYKLGIFVGVASNPSLVAAAGARSEDMVREVLAIVPDPVFIQVSGLTSEDMVREGRMLASIDPARVVVKIPVTIPGLEAIHTLAAENVRITATAICAANEALLAARAGATFLAPYMARIYDIGGDGCQVVADMVELVEQHALPSHVIAASVRTPEELMLAWKVGAEYAAIQSNVIAKIGSNPAVEASAEKFHADYTQAFGN